MPIDKLFRSKKSQSVRKRDRANRSNRVSGSYQSLEDRKMLAGDVAGPAYSPHAVDRPIVAPVITSNPPVQRIVDGTDVDLQNDPYPSVGIVGDLNGGFCTGTLIAPTYVLTAAHCVAGGNIKLPDNQGTFEVGGQTYGTTRVEVHPLYDDFNFAAGWDIAVYELDRPVLGITPSPLYRTTPVVGQQLTLVGFGGGGTGADGFTPDFGTKRFGVTDIDQVTDQHIRWNFEDNQDPPESNTAPGDSGGPAFIDVNGTLHVAGITSGGTQFDAGFGDNSFDIRVDIFIDYINSVINGRDEHGDLPDASATFVRHGADGTVRTGGRLQRLGDRDVFRMQFRQQGFVVFRVNGAEPVDTYLRMYNSDGLLLTQNDNFDGTNSRVAASVQPGTYYFSVGALNDAQAGDFFVWSSLKTFGVVIPDDHADTVDAKASIYDLENNGTGRQSGRISAPVDRDVFQVTTEERGTAFIRVNGFNGLNPEVQVFDSFGRSIAYNDNFNGTLNSGLDFQFLPGTYYIAVSASGDRSTGGFNTWSNFRTLVARDDHGGFLNNSTGISLSPAGTAFGSGVITTSQDRDMFFFTATRFSKQYVIRVNGVSNNLDTIVSVYNSAGQRIASNDDFFGTNSRVFFSAAAGETFYVSVDGKGSSTGQFNMAIFNRG